MVIDLGGTRTTSQLSSIVDDFGSVNISSEQEAMRKDWSVIGEDVLSAMIAFGKENGKPKSSTEEKPITSHPENANEDN